MQPYAPNAPSKAEALVAALRNHNTTLCHDAADEIERLRAQEYKLARRIHQQRVALRENWQIIEDRSVGWMGSPSGRRRFSLPSQAQ